MNTCSETQPFGGNANPSYAQEKLAGHTGIDVTCGFDTPVRANYDGYVYKILNNLQPAVDGSGYWMVATLCQSGNAWHEHSYGHVNTILVKEGDYIKRGDIIGTEGNHGTVYENGLQITPEMQRAGDRRGHHRHYQDRQIEKVPQEEISKTYLSGYGMNVYHEKDGSCFLIPHYDNGYNGCVNFPVTGIYDLYPPALEPLTPEAEKTVEDGIVVATKLAAYPQFRTFIVSFLQKLSNFLSFYK